MRGKQLYVDRPLITAFPYHADLFAVIQDIPTADKWIMNYMLRLRVNKICVNNMFLDFATGDACNLINNSPFIKLNIAERESIEDIIEFAVDTIDNDRYIYVPVDRYYISVCDEYLKYHMNHDMLISGYDAEKRVLYYPIKDSRFLNDDRYCWGVDIYPRLIRNIGTMKEGKCITPLRSYQILLEHKKLMYKTLDFMLGERCLRITGNDIEGYCEIVSNVFPGAVAEKIVVAELGHGDAFKLLIFFFLNDKDSALRSMQDNNSGVEGLYIFCLRLQAI